MWNFHVQKPVCVQTGSPHLISAMPRLDPDPFLTTRNKRFNLKQILNAFISSSKSVSNTNSVGLCLCLASQIAFQTVSLSLSMFAAITSAHICTRDIPVTGLPHITAQLQTCVPLQQSAFSPGWQRPTSLLGVFALLWGGGEFSCWGPVWALFSFYITLPHFYIYSLESLLNNIKMK